MENDGEATTSQQPEPGRGAGGKMRRPPNRYPRATPYARPNSNKPQAGGGGWLSKLVDPAWSLISGGAARILPSLFSRSPSLVSLPPLPDDDDDDDDDDDGLLISLSCASLIFAASSCSCVIWLIGTDDQINWGGGEVLPFLD
ncbi:hypothetical protein NL676_030538 [Syzygium grande]|nr:hypothetical protein NL676_030538 [Syzygium grande]